MMDYSAFASILAIIIPLIMLSDSYNIEERKCGITKGYEGSQFGYTVALVPSPGWKSDQSIIKYKTLLVGAPNVTYKGIRGHGQLYECSDILTKNVNCKLLDTSGTSNMCEILRKRNKNRTACEQDSRFGSSLAVNRYYIENVNTSHYGTIPMVMVCAPWWKNPLHETNKKQYQNYMVGKCIKLTDNLETIPCERDGKFGCWPFWSNGGTAVRKDGKPLYIYAEAGFSLAFTKDGYGVVGGPGVDNWKGAFTSPNKKWMVMKSQFPDTTYFGYNLKAAKLRMGAVIIVGAPNFHRKNKHGHRGQVMIYKGEDEKATINYGIYYECQANGVNNKLSNSDFENLIKTKQNGNKFGAVLESVDLNGDGFDEVLVAAPLYTGENPDEGRVFVYTFTSSGVCGPIAVLSGGSRNLSLKDKTIFARFGTCMASVGNLDNHDSNDIAIGAPYEDNGVGAVYIYNGYHDHHVHDQFSQRISGQTVDLGIRTFGWSMYGNEDIDNNGFPDIVVGAYESDTVVVLRTRPVVSVNFDLIIHPSTIPLNTSLQNCSGDTNRLCFNVIVTLAFTPFGPRHGYLQNISVLLTMKADTLYMALKNTSRIVFLGTNSSYLHKNLTVENGNLTEDVIPLLVLGNPEPKDVWTKIRIEGSIEILESAGNNFDVLDPVLFKAHKKHKIEDVEFDKKCNDLETCTSDLQVKLDTIIIGKDHRKYVAYYTEIYVGEATELMIVVDVRSEHGMSHYAYFTSNVSADLSRPISPDHGLIAAECELMDPSNTSEYTFLMCKAMNSLFLQRNVRVKFYYDISSAVLLPDNDLDQMKDFLMIEIKAEQQNPDVNIDNNLFAVLIPIRLKHKIVIQEDDNVEDQIYYDDDVESYRPLSILQRYYISNRGPSFLHLTYVNISVPVMKNGVQIAMIKNISNICLESGHYDGKDIHKEINGSAGILDSTEDDVHGNMKIISCLDENYDCAVIECKMINMESNKQEVIEFTVDLFEKELAKESVHGIRYATFADVTDPYIWNGKKSVAWTKPVFAQKWTTFVHEQNVSTPKVKLWIIILSGIGGVILLAAIITILWKCKFFERKRHYKIKDWKEERRRTNNSTSQIIEPDEL